ncbi:MAG: twin-arginine translocase TatA/TatE family subunit [Methylobacterium sp.]|jgi:sec-independent protein translocase protein TatA|nr:twin-arginine translocase TatA/TatE family subunit [Methylobacterium sp.]
MGSMSIWHWLIVAVVVLLLFGRGKIPELMGDVAKGIKNFKAGMKEDEQAAAEKAKELEAKAAETVQTQTQTPASQPPKAS